MQANQAGLVFSANGEELIPGIPNEITLDHIVTKIPWRVFHILSSVSPVWLHAIRSRQVHDARVRSHSAETLILINRELDSNCASIIELFSMRDNSCCQLPPIPGFRDGFPRKPQCVSIDGKVYVLGGQVRCRGEVSWKEEASAKVYVFDVAGQVQWLECANMKKAKIDFGCGVLDGKIYICGGESASRRSRPDPVSEVYNPKENTWSPISPIPSLRVRHLVTAVGQELFVHKGQICVQFISRICRIPVNRRAQPGHPSTSTSVTKSMECADFFEIYNPVKDEWRLVKPPKFFGCDFVAHGKLHRINEERGIELFDSQQNSWVHLHSVSYALSGQVEQVGSGCVTIIHAFNDELLAIVFCENRKRCCLVRSSGLGSEKKEIVFQETPVSSPSGDLQRRYSHQLRLSIQMSRILL
ncbi:unnamed protein product [Calypogeia fissa]